MNIFDQYAKMAFKKYWNNHENLSFCFEKVFIEDVEFCVSFLSPNNIEYLKGILVHNYKRLGFLFELSIEEMKLGHFPPIIEVTKNKNIILDGAHRLFAAYVLGLKTVNLLVLTSDNQPPPCCKTYNIHNIMLREVPCRSHEIIFDDMNENLFRPMRIILNDVKQHIERISKF